MYAHTHIYIYVQIDQYLRNTPTQYHTADSITNLTKALSDLPTENSIRLTKAEKLQIVNNCPTKEIDTYVVCVSF